MPDEVRVQRGGRDAGGGIFRIACPAGKLPRAEKKRVISVLGGVRVKAGRSVLVAERPEGFIVRIKRVDRFP